jgi:hypothetical protein
MQLIFQTIALSACSVTRSDRALARVTFRIVDKREISHERFLFSLHKGSHLSNESAPHHQPQRFQLLEFTLTQQESQSK